jgi:hypothetical protein
MAHGLRQLSVAANKAYTAARECNATSALGVAARNPRRNSRLHRGSTVASACGGGDIPIKILESFPCFIVTEATKEELQRLGATGVLFGPVEVTKSFEFDQVYPGRELPGFVWLKPEGKSGHNDVATANDGRLVVSPRAPELFKRLGIANALIEPVASK